MANNLISGFGQLLDVKRYALILVIVWVATIALLFSWHHTEISGNMVMSARTQAQDSFEQDLVYRRWSAIHGGVYVPPTERTPPNPYLSHIKTRDITTTDGMNLTLMNPAYMTRQVHELGKEQYGHQAHITSLNPIRPENAPDAWEAEALRAFERGRTRVIEIASIEGEEYLRLMRPMIAEKGCLRCHASQGYKEGDLRGGISVSVPMEPLRLIMHNQVFSVAKGYIFIFLLGLCGIVFGAWRIQSLIHQRSLSNQALRESEEKFRALYDNAPLSYQSLDENGFFLDVNPTWLKMLGYARDEVIGKRYADFLHPDWKPDFEKNFPEFKRCGSVHDVQFKIRHKDGHYLDISFEGCIGYLPDGSFRQTYCVFHDISARKRVEAEKERLLAGIEQASEAIVTTDVEGTIEYINPAFERMTGYSHDEAVGQNPRILKSGQQNAAFYSNLWKTLAAGEIWKGRFVNRRKNGEFYTEKATISPVIDSSGRIINYVAIKADITAELARDKQLRQMQKMESVGRMAGGIGHEFNNALQSVLGFSELILLENDSSAAQRQNVSEIQKAAQHAAELTRQLMTFSRKVPTQFNPLDLNAVLFVGQQILKRALNEKIRLQFEPADRLELANADTSQIMQIAMNLMVNARDAMPDGGTVTLCTGNREFMEEDRSGIPDFKAGKFVFFSVSDTGCGMNENQLAHLFDPFYTTKPLGEGTGLGLSVVYGIVEEHGGWVSVSSKPGQGSVFQVFLPVIDASAPNSSVAQDAALPGKCILLAEADLAVRDLTSEILKGVGYAVSFAESIDESKKLFAAQNGSFDLLFIDVELPGGSGVELAEELLSQNGELAVLFISSAEDSSSEGRIVEKGYAFLRKPFGIKKLLDAVAQVIKGS